MREREREREKERKNEREEERERDHLFHIFIKYLAFAESFIVDIPTLIHILAFHPQYHLDTTKRERDHGETKRGGREGGGERERGRK